MIKRILTALIMLTSVGIFHGQQTGGGGAGAGGGGGGGPTGAAGGGLSGTYPNPTLTGPGVTSALGYTPLAPTGSGASLTGITPTQVGADASGAAAAAVASNAITANRFTINGVNEFGDSITVGVGAVSPVYDYANILCAAFGTPCTNYGRSGDYAADQVNNKIYPFLNPTRYGNAPDTIMIGTNDANHSPFNTGVQNNYSHTLMSGLAWATIPYEFKIQPQLGITSGNCTTTGTWTNTTYGNNLALSSIVPGSTLTCTSLTQGDAAVYGNWFAKDGLTATATFAIDGTTVDTWDAFGFNGQVIATINGTTQTAFATRYALTGSGSHTYKVTVGTAGTSNAFTFLWVGSPAPATPINLGGMTQNPPRIAVAGVPRQSADANSTATAALNTLALSTATTMAADGLLIYPVNIRNYVDLDYATLDSDMAASPTTLPNGLVTPASVSNPVHPNGGISNGVVVGGHRHLADAFLATMPPPAITPSTLPTTAPAGLEFLGTGVDGDNLTASGLLTGEHWYKNFTVPFSNTVTVSVAGLVIHATGTCSIYGNIFARGGIETATGPGIAGAGGGGSGGGAAVGFVGPATTVPAGGATGAGGTLGAIGSNGGNGGVPASTSQRLLTASGTGTDYSLWGGASGVVGGSSGGAKGVGGGSVIMICGSIIGSDGTHTGVIDVSGGAGGAVAANSTGGGSGAGGGVIILSSQAPIATPPAIYAAPGVGGQAIVPYAVGTSGQCQVQPVISLGVTAGALDGTYTIVNAGTNCNGVGNLGTGVGVGTQWTILGGGGTPGTASITPTWSGTTLASVVVTPGTSSGYTQASFTTAGNGGQGGPGWFYVTSGW